MKRHTKRNKIPVSILGATGLVGQRLVRLLENHPWFEVADLVASDRSAGKRYGEAVRWVTPGAIPEGLATRRVLPPGEPLGGRIVFSVLDREAALELEPFYAGKGHWVVSNASAFRDDPRVPLIIPEVNPDALALTSDQPWEGGIVTNPNCCVVGLVLALAPLHRQFGLESVVVVTLQALSGAGVSGVSSVEATGNVIPFIPGEAEKIAAEPLRILEDNFPVSVSVNRVPVIDGHTLSVFVKLREPAGIRAISETMAGFEAPERVVELPSCPRRPVVVTDDPFRPQPRLDSETGKGLVVTVGQVRADPVYDAGFTVVVHNAVRGAAGAALLNAELWCSDAGSRIQSR
jgi:aspartate-semialdehyde dehydrogenase